MTKAAHQNKTRSVTRRRSPTAIGDAIKAALADKEMTVADMELAPAKPKRSKRTVTRNRKNQKRNIEKRVGIGWEHPLSTLTISMDEGNCEQVQADGPYTWARIKFDDYQPDMLNVRFNTTETEGNTLTYVVFGEDRIQKVEGKLPSMTIPVTWENNVPSVRLKHEDNADIIFMDEFGRFVQLMVGVVVRSWKNHKTGKTGWAVYLYLQEQFTGQVVRTTVAKAKSLDLSHVQHDGMIATVIPLFDYHAYDGVNWLGITGSANFGPGTLVPTALDEGRSVALHQASAQTWNPPELGESSSENRKRGVVLWFNVAWNGGSGFIQMEDGNNIFLHWSQLRNTFAPQPMSVVEFTPGEFNGKPQARGVRVVEVADAAEEAV